MAELRAVAVKNGLRSPETYIQSGNLIIDADIAADEVRVLLEKAIAQRFGLRVDVIVRAASQWRRYVVANAFSIGEEIQRKAELQRKQAITFVPRAQLVHSKASIAALKPGNSSPLGQGFAMRGSVIWYDSF